MPEDNAVPPLTEGEFIHFEYLHFDPADAETGFSNYVEISRDRYQAASKAVDLISDPKVWAIHIRRYEQPEQGVHLYDETQPLAVAQNQAYAERKRAETLQKLLGAAVESNRKLEDAYERQIARLEMRLEAEQALTESAVGKLREIAGRAQRAQRDSYFLEPSEVYLDTKFNLQAERESELRKAEERRKAREEGTESQESLDDICNCGHPRRDHQGDEDLGRAQCKVCPGDDERSWRHPFTLADQ